ncbi:MAG: lysylphosphatidylglycerol synthase transmembrane domain-containing protein, partial [Dehalococcoidia bacterium]
MRSRRFWIGLAVSVLFLFLFLYRVDLGEMAGALKEANYTFVLPALALYGASMLFRSLRWRFLLRPLKSLGVGRLFPVVVIGYMANNLLPVRLGELVRAYYLSERERVSASATLATIVLERVYDGLTLLFFIAVASLFLPLSGLLKGVEDALGLPGALVAVLLTVPFLGAIVFLTLLASFPQRVGVTAGWVLRLLPLRLRPRVAELIERFLQGLSVLRSPRLLLELFLLSLPVWILEASVAYLLAFAFDLPAALGSLA